MRPALLSLLLGLSVPAILPAQSCPQVRTALVLSGGGAKGLAHIGVLRALDSLGIHPDIVVGTSIGAIVGGMYASGYSGKEIDSLAQTLPLGRVFRTYQPTVPLSLGIVQPLVVWEQDDGILVFQRAAVLEPEVNALLAAGLLRGNLLARGNFDSLPIPFRAVATDLLSGAPHIFAGGDLARAVRASAAIPLLLEPERVDGRFLGDGGLSANVPVIVARNAGATRLIVSYTTEGRPDSLNLQSALVMIDHLIGNLFRQSPDSLGPDDLAIRPDVDGFQSFNFSPAAVHQLIRQGNEAAIEVLAGASCLRGAGAEPRKEQLPPPSHVVMSFEESARPDSAYIRKMLRLIPDAPLDIRTLQVQLRSLGTLGRYSSMWLNPTGSRDTIVFHIAVRPTAPRVLAVSAAYDNDLGGRISIGYLQRNFLRHDLEASTRAMMGERGQEVSAGLRLLSFARVPLVPVATVGLFRELIRRFDGEEELGARKTLGARAFAGLETDWRDGWHSSIGLEGSSWSEGSGVTRLAAGPRLSVFKVGSGAETLFTFDASATDEYRRLAIEGIATITIGRLKVRPHARAGYGYRLPEHLRFVLGGVDGFAGLHIGEQRHSREALGSLVLLYPVRGKLFLRVEPMVGASAEEGGTLPKGPVMAGVRAGFDLSTTLGPIRVEYGVGEKGRDALLVRMGRWF